MNKQRTLSSRIKKKIGLQIRKHRMNQGLTQAALAKLCNMPASYVSAIERGINNLTIDTICKIARSLNCSITDLFADDDEPVILTVDAMRAKIKAMVDRMPAHRLSVLLKLIAVAL